MNKNPKTLIAITCICTIATGWLTIINIDWLAQTHQIVRDAGAFGGVVFVIAYAIATFLILPITAFNIAGTGTASPQAMIAAILMASDCAARRLVTPAQVAA